MKKDNVLPKKKWEFDESVTSVFDNMLERSIPQYLEMRKLVSNLSKQVIEKNDLPTNTIIDIGCSKGRALESVHKIFPSFNYIGVEVSESMYLYCKENYKQHNIRFYNNDLIDWYPQTKPDNSLTLSILTLCFIPIEYRSYVLKNIYNNLCIDGSLIIVEKCLSNNYDTSEYFDNVYYDLKSKNGYTQEQIKSKRKSLEGVLVPLTTSFNEELFKQVGFKKIDIFWKYLNFTGWIMTK
ncbi:MAG: putative carboxy-S-adenosyl-L-methionine synthase [Prokaryotic dsDNA virus sp.]|nr:MAG: putative carboxy-S-adenosyl-L-methionine synthase [Prokaryotic dsDNA virus sp.]|tara:strand:+ start:19201 stop:19914 length:714 start_codon:yes stop_codon:yes gene_type:complete